MIPHWTVGPLFCLHNIMRFGIQSVGTIVSRSPRIKRCTKHVWRRKAYSCIGRIYILCRVRSVWSQGTLVAIMHSCKLLKRIFFDDPRIRWKLINERPIRPASVPFSVPDSAKRQTGGRSAGPSQNTGPAALSTAARAHRAGLHTGHGAPSPVLTGTVHRPASLFCSWFGWRRAGGSLAGLSQNTGPVASRTDQRWQNTVGVASGAAAANDLLETVLIGIHWSLSADQDEVLGIANSLKEGLGIPLLRIPDPGMLTSLST